MYKFCVALASFMLIVNLNYAQQLSCGSGNFQTHVATTLISSSCKNGLAQFDGCCRTHDGCYHDQKGRKLCDGTLCDCLINSLLSFDSKACRRNAELFCNLVTLFGSKAYSNSGKKLSAQNK
uniref:Uncharacterized protein n=1 Tax=Panagrolaimus superbus TaxID=310955 RepID=A0A914YSY0_9BILA